MNRRKHTFLSNMPRMTLRGGLGRYDGGGPLPLDEVHDPVVVISLVCDHVVGLDPGQEGYALWGVRSLTSCKDEADGLAVRIDRHVNLRAQSPS